jgi:hypothetical protein
MMSHLLAPTLIAELATEQKFHKGEFGVAHYPWGQFFHGASSA